MSSNFGAKLQARDLQVLRDLALSPLEAPQIALLSCRYEREFPTTGQCKALRERMLKLQQLGLVAHFEYQTTTSGVQKYYKLTRDGYRTVHGPNKALPARSFFQPVSPSLQNHTRSLANFFVHTLRQAHVHHVTVTGVYGENELVLKMGSQSLKPDASFQFKNRGKQYNCLFELDCGTEPVASTKQRESLQQKIQFILEYEKRCDTKFKHFTIFRTTSPRLAHYLQLVKDLSPDPRRNIFHAALLERYIDAGDVLRSSVWLTMNGHLASIIPNRSADVAALSPQLPATRSLAAQLVAT